MRAALPSFPFISSGIENLRIHRIELVLLGGMVVSIGLVSGTAFKLLTNPNLGQTMKPVSLLKPGALQDVGISAVGDALLELSKPLRIEVVTTSNASEESEALTIVSPEEFQPQLLEKTHRAGTRILLLTLAAGGGLAMVARFGPSLPVWPRRRRPLGERLTPSDVSEHPLGVKRLKVPLVKPKTRIKRTVPAEALADTVFQPFNMNPARSKGTQPLQLGEPEPSVVMTAHVSSPPPQQPIGPVSFSLEAGVLASESIPPKNTGPKNTTSRQAVHPKRRILHVKPAPANAEPSSPLAQSSPSAPSPASKPCPSQPTQSNRATGKATAPQSNKATAPQWLRELDLRQAAPVQALL